MSATQDQQKGADSGTSSRTAMPYPIVSGHEISKTPAGRQALLAYYKGLSRKDTGEAREMLSRIDSSADFVLSGLNGLFWRVERSHHSFLGQPIKPVEPVFDIRAIAIFPVLVFTPVPEMFKPTEADILGNFPEKYRPSAIAYKVRDASEKKKGSRVPADMYVEREGRAYRVGIVKVFGSSKSVERPYEHLEYEDSAKLTRSIVQSWVREWREQQRARSTLLV